MQNDSHCTVCKKNNEPSTLLCCESCPRVYHLGCLTPPLKSIPRGDWFCEQCASLQSVQQLDRILASRPMQQVRHMPLTHAHVCSPSGWQWTRELAHFAPGLASEYQAPQLALECRPAASLGPSPFNSVFSLQSSCKLESHQSTFGGVQ